MTKGEINKMMSKIIEWRKTCRKMEELKEREYTERSAISSELLGEKIEGSRTFEVERLRISAVAVINYRIDKNQLEKCSPKLTKKDKEALRYVPTLNEAKFRALPGDSVLRDCVVTSKGKYQLKIVKDLA